MRLQSEIKVGVRGKLIGGPTPLVCVPLVAKEQKELFDQASIASRYAPDLIEWRVDSYAKVADIPDCIGALDKLRDVIGEIPLIFTCRIASEGGMQNIDPRIRLDLFNAAIASDLADIIDIEMCNGADFIQGIREAASGRGTKVILSYHDFEATPQEEFICDKLRQAQKMGADIAKVACMPKNNKDVLRLLSATLQARTEFLKIPIVTMSMGSIGAVSRVAGGLFGSDITFAVAKESSAPGQIPIGDLKAALKAIIAVG